MQVALRKTTERRRPIGLLLIAEIRPVDDQSVSFPVASGIAIPLAQAGIQMRTPIKRDNSNIVHALVENRDVSRRLQNLDSLVVFLRDARHGPGEAAVIGGNVFPRIDQLILSDALRGCTRLRFSAQFLSPLG